jgi:gliding motility-associated-like protein
MLFLVGIGSFEAMATHNRAGEITYCHLQGNTYQITITTITKTTAPADRQWLPILFGDEPSGAPSDSVERSSITFGPPGEDYQINKYITTHTYPGPGTYKISMLDPNRNGGVLNMWSSIDQPFYIETVLRITPETSLSDGHNCSVQLLNLALDKACRGKLWTHNPGAFDPDGDQLVFSLIPCRCANSQSNCPDWVSPDDLESMTTGGFGTHNDTFVIDPVTGTITWQVPWEIGEYNIAILVEEYRNGIFVGSVVRDMQITVVICDNDPPVFAPVQNICINAGEQINFFVQATDPNNDPITLSASGGPFGQTTTPAFFNPNTGQFIWTPQCPEVRQQPYIVLFTAIDAGNQVSLSANMTVLITVVGPAVENPEALPAGNDMILTWDENPCIGVYSSNQIQLGKYLIYRRAGLYGFEPAYCELGVPAYTGYQLITSQNGLDNTSFIDDLSVGFGGEYCYMIVTVFPDGAISYASVEFCASLIKDVPIMTHASILATDEANGEVYVEWSPPSEMDLENFSGPYYYELYHSPGYGVPNQLIFTSEIEANLFDVDTVFTHTGVNTVAGAHTYSARIFSAGAEVDRATPGSSIFLTLTPNDEQLHLSWPEAWPWINIHHDIFRWNSDLSDFELIGTSSTNSYTDMGLINNREYCYYVRAKGTFFKDDIIDPVNLSQRVCGKPFDLTPPCAPDLTAEPDCDEMIVTFTWNNPNNSCADDVTQYKVYWSPTPNSEPILIHIAQSSEDTTFVFNLNNQFKTIAGCFYVTALDSILPAFGGVLNQNESTPSNVICTDNCPIYFLPNIFTPNGDGVNDFFIPLPYKFVESIDLKIFNRWGGLIFETTDPDINWDGRVPETGQMASDGVYYYTVVVNTIRLSGIESVVLNGYVHLSDGRNTNPKTN